MLFVCATRFNCILPIGLTYLLTFPERAYSVRSYLSVDIDVSDLQVNQCNADTDDNEANRKTGSTTPLTFASLMQQQQDQQTATSIDSQSAARRSRRTISHETVTSNQVEAFHGSHKCHSKSMQVSNWRLKPKQVYYSHKLRTICCV